MGNFFSKSESLCVGKLRSWAFRLTRIRIHTMHPLSSHVYIKTVLWELLVRTWTRSWRLHKAQAFTGKRNYFGTNRTKTLNLLKKSAMFFENSSNLRSWKITSGDLSFLENCQHLEFRESSSFWIFAWVEFRRKVVGSHRRRVGWTGRTIETQTPLSFR